MINKNNIGLGIVLGTLSPLALYGLYILAKNNFELYISESFAQILCIAINGIVFRIYIKKELDNTAKGILASTFVYALIYFWIKLFAH